jgi:uncharacterized protein with PIN domain
VTFVVDAMLGKLAKWLRAMGHDTHYQARYEPHVIDRQIKKGRWLVSRDRNLCSQYETAVRVQANRVAEQLAELNLQIPLGSNREAWFCRCLRCNTLLQEANLDRAKGNVPEYVFYRHSPSIRLCPSCGRYYWPGSHRTRMIRQLEVWGFGRDLNS